MRAEPVHGNTSLRRHISHRCVTVEITANPMGLGYALSWHSRRCTSDTMFASLIWSA